jgi:hypothetical protein
MIRPNPLPPPTLISILKHLPRPQRKNARKEKDRSAGFKRKKRRKKKAGLTLLL